MVAVKVVERAVHEVVDVVAVRDGRVAASGAVLRGALHRGAGGRMAAVDLEDVLGDARAARRVEVPVVEIIRVIAMTDGPMTAARTVHVGVVVPVLHGDSPSWRGSIDPGEGRGQAGREIT